MVDQIAVVTFTTPASTGTFPVTHPSITEAFNCAILIYSHTTTDDSNSSGGCMGVGFVSTEAGPSASTEASSTVNLHDFRSTTTQAFQDESGGAAAECIRSSDPGVVVEVVADFSAAIAGGVELNFTTTSVQVSCTAILFAGLSRSAIGNCTFLDSSIDHEDVGDIGVGAFQPDCIVFLSSDNTLDGVLNNGQPKIGFAINTDSGIQQISAYMNIDRASDPTVADGYYRTDCATSAFIGDRTVEMDRIQITSFDSTGFNATAAATAGANSPQANYLAIKWGNSSLVRMALGHLPVAASTGNQTYNTFGFTPDILFGLSHLMTVADTIDSAEANVCSAGYFVTGRYGSRAISVHHDYGHTIAAGTESDANTRQGSHAVLTLTGLGAVAHQASWVGGSGSGGFVLNFTTADQAGTLTALGIQIIPSPPLPSRRIRRPTKRSKRISRLPALPQGKAAAEAIPRFWRAIKRFRELMLRRLRKPKEFFPSGGAVFSDVVASPMADVYSAGSVRGTVDAGGAEAGDVF